MVTLRHWERLTAALMWLIFLIMFRIVLGIITPDADTITHGDIYPVGAPDGIIDMSDLLTMYQLVIVP